MFVFTARLTKKKLAGIIAGAGATLILIIALVASRGSSQALGPAGEVKGIKSDADRVAYLEGLGWSVEAQPITVQEVLIPEEWNSVFESYNDIQLEQGFDLEKYKGKRVKLYSFSVKNHPSGKDNVQANLLCYKNSIIGGDVQCPSLDGFMHGLGVPDDLSFSSDKAKISPSPSPSAGSHQAGDCPKDAEGNECKCEEDPDECKCEDCEH